MIRRYTSEELQAMIDHGEDEPIGKKLMYILPRH